MSTLLQNKNAQIGKYFPNKGEGSGGGRSGVGGGAVLAVIVENCAVRKLY